MNRPYGTLRNLLFLSGDPVQPRWLFNDADQMLARAEPLCAKGSADYFEACPQAEKRTLAVYLEVIAKDSNRNGALDHEDRAVPALVRTDGTGYTRRWALRSTTWSMSRSRPTGPG